MCEKTALYGVHVKKDKHEEERDASFLPGCSLGSHDSAPFISPTISTRSGTYNIFNTLNKYSALITVYFQD